jgi:hypothetical protein
MGRPVIHPDGLSPRCRLRICVGYYYRRLRATLPTPASDALAL